MKQLSNLSGFQKLMLLNAHPIKMVFNYIGGAIGLYFLWQHRGWYALIFGLGVALLGTLISKLFGGYDAQKIASTLWGKIFLCYSTTIGFILYISSHILIPYACWAHNLYLGLLGLAFLCIGFLIYRKEYF